MLLIADSIPGMETAGIMPVISHPILTAGTVRITILTTIPFTAHTEILIHGQIHIIAPDGPAPSVTTGDQTGITDGVATSVILLATLIIIMPGVHPTDMGMEVTGMVMDTTDRQLLL